MNGFLSRIGIARTNLLKARGLLNVSFDLPPRPVGETFEWIIEPKCDLAEAHGAVWYIDGSLHDQYKEFCKALGYGIVIVSSEGDLLGVACGRPSPWVIDAAGAELWAFYVVASMNIEVPFVVTDCKGVLDGLYDGFQACTTSKKKLARTWNLVGSILDGDFAFAASQTRWMPAHGATAHHLHYVEGE